MDQEGSALEMETLCLFPPTSTLSPALLSTSSLTTPPSPTMSRSPTSVNPTSSTSSTRRVLSPISTTKPRSLKPTRSSSTSSWERRLSSRTFEEDRRRSTDPTDRGRTEISSNTNSRTRLPSLTRTSSPRWVSPGCLDWIPTSCSVACSFSSSSSSSSSNSSRSENFRSSSLFRVTAPRYPASHPPSTTRMVPWQ